MIGLNHNKSKRKPTCPSSFPQKMLTFFSGVDIYRARSRHDDSFSKVTFPQMTWTKWTVCGADVRSDVMPCAQFFFSDRFPVLPFFVSNMRRAASHIQINNFIFSYYIWWRLLFLIFVAFSFCGKGTPLQWAPSIPIPTVSHGLWDGLGDVLFKAPRDVLAHRYMTCYFRIVLPNTSGVECGLL